MICLVVISILMMDLYNVFLPLYYLNFNKAYSDSNILEGLCSRLTKSPILFKREFEMMDLWHLFAFPGRIAPKNFGSMK